MRVRLEAIIRFRADTAACGLSASKQTSLPHMQFSHPKATSTPTDAPIVGPHVTLNTDALAVALAAAQLAITGRLKRGALPWVRPPLPSLLLTTLLRSLHVPPMWPSQPPSLLPLLIFSI